MEHEGSGVPWRRPGGNWSVQRIDKGTDAHHNTILYEIDMLRFSYRRIVMPPDGATDADVWAYLESFLVHYRNLLDFFGNEEPRKTDLTLSRPQDIWPVHHGADTYEQPTPRDIEQMRQKGLALREEYEDSSKQFATISRYLQHCTTFRTSPKEWYPVKMMHDIGAVLTMLEKHLPRFTPAKDSRPVDRDHFLGGQSVSTASRSRGRF